MVIRTVYSVAPGDVIPPVLIPSRANGYLDVGGRGKVSECEGVLIPSRANGDSDSGKEITCTTT